MELFSTRKKTKEVKIGPITIGGDHPVAVQSMIVEDTKDTEGCVKAIINLHQKKCEIIRVTAPSIGDAKALGTIRERLDEVYGEPVALVADVHHNGWKIAQEVAKHVDKVRINPGLFVFKKSQGGEYTEEEIEKERSQISEQLKPVIDACKEHNTAMRIGVNHGSLSERMMFMYGDTPEGMVESAMEFIEICEAQGYYEIVLSLKASRVPVVIAANRLMMQRMEERGGNVYPLHLGVTEAGDGEYARIKSTAGIGTLLAEGIGDTIRVSLAEDPEKEIPVCYDILQALGLRKTKVEFIACPSCGRTKFLLREVVPQVRYVTNHLDKLSIAIMGCIVNGPGEMADADYGYVGKGIGKVAIYRGHEEVISNVHENDGLKELVGLIKADGNWEESPLGSIEELLETAKTIQPDD